jgi:hypothetical protein
MKGRSAGGDNLGVGAEEGERVSSDTRSRGLYSQDEAVGVVVKEKVAARRGAGGDKGGGRRTDGSTASEGAKVNKVLKAAGVGEWQSGRDVIKAGVHREVLKRNVVREASRQVVSHSAANGTEAADLNFHGERIFKQQRSAHLVEVTAEVTTTRRRTKEVTPSSARGSAEEGVGVDGRRPGREVKGRKGEGVSTAQDEAVDGVVNNEAHAGGESDGGVRDREREWRLGSSGEGEGKTAEGERVKRAESGHAAEHGEVKVDTAQNVLVSVLKKAGGDRTSGPGGGCVLEAILMIESGRGQVSTQDRAKVARGVRVATGDEGVSNARIESTAEKDAKLAEQSETVATPRMDDFDHVFRLKPTPQGRRSAGEQSGHFADVENVHVVGRRRDSGDADLQ